MNRRPTNSSSEPSALDQLSKTAKVAGKLLFWSPRGRHGEQPDGKVHVSKGRFTMTERKEKVSQ